ncbi:MAG TPA: hypothetical protein VK968_02160 [Roseimicrobium sp.]|nr:hypothetical protein [Roseimicrobium sp.]
MKFQTTPSKHPPGSRRWWVHWIVIFTLLHYLAVVLLNTVLFFASHVPPQMLPLDKVIDLLTSCFQVLRWPRPFFRMLWPGEMTPGWLNFLLTLATSVCWGAFLAMFHRWRTKDHPLNPPVLG